MANGKRAGLVKAANRIGAADFVGTTGGPGRSSQKGSPNFGRGRPPETGLVPAAKVAVRAASVARRLRPRSTFSGRVLFPTWSSRTKSGARPLLPKETTRSTIVIGIRFCLK